MAGLRLKLQELQAEQDRIRQDLSVTQAERQTLQRAINAIQSQIKLVESQIAATNTQIDITHGEIVGVEQGIADTRADMSRKRATIGRMILFLEQRDQEDLVASLFKYAGFAQFFRQLDDVAAVQQKLLAVVDELKEDKATLERYQLTLEAKEDDLHVLSDEAATRRNQLATVRNQQNQVLTQTKGQEAAYQAAISALEKEKEKFFTELRELELKAASGGLFIVHITADKVPAKGTKLFQWPYTGTYWITQSYGYTQYAKRGAYGGAPHNGIDIAAGYGTPIHAIGAGTIVANGTGNPGWGNWLAIQHPNNMVSVYAHMSSFIHSVGTEVAVGQVIGYEGNTGAVSGSNGGYHLHLSLYRDFFTYLKGDQLYFNYFDGTLNPRDYIAEP